ncbi:MAG: PKD domain-containing protein, partial [Planctomycetaceae bacterium]|nr:PKD domain-containing protein [Planctomycetaceae bacterium]
MIPRRDRTGLSLIEVTVSTLLTGLIIVGALRCVAGTAGSQTAAVNRTQAVLLAEDLLEEILQLDYAEPDDAVLFGRENGEAAASRAAWDDADDYHGWQSSPPQDRAGTAVASSRWERRVAVAIVSKDDPGGAAVTTGDTGVKRITVSVLYDGILLATLTGLQTEAWISMIPDYAEATTTGQLPPVNSAPSAFIAVHTMSGTGSLTVALDGGASTDPENQPLEFTWDFGDDSAGSGETVSHTFVNTGNNTHVFTVTLTVRDIHGAQDVA